MQRLKEDCRFFASSFSREMIEYGFFGTFCRIYLPIVLAIKALQN